MKQILDFLCRLKLWEKSFKKFSTKVFQKTILNCTFHNAFLNIFCNVYIPKNLKIVTVYFKLVEL